MMVKELIEQLKKRDQDSTVLVLADVSDDSPSYAAVGQLGSYALRGGIIRCVAKPNAVVLWPGEEF